MGFVADVNARLGMHDLQCRFSLMRRLPLLILLELFLSLMHRLYPKSVDFCLNA